MVSHQAPDINWIIVFWAVTGLSFGLILAQKNIDNSAVFSQTNFFQI